MVRVEGVLERAPSAASTIASAAEWLVLLNGSVAAVVRRAVVGVAAEVHQTVGLVVVLLAAPDSPGDETHDTEHDETADSHDNANDSVTSLSRHAR